MAAFAAQLPLASLSSSLTPSHPGQMHCVSLLMYVCTYLLTDVPVGNFGAASSELCPCLFIYAQTTLQSSLERAAGRILFKYKMMTECKS